MGLDGGSLGLGFGDTDSWSLVILDRLPVVKVLSETNLQTHQSR